MNTEQHKDGNPWYYIENFVHRLFTDHPIYAIASLFLFTGVALFILYYSQIDYFPSVDIQGVMTYLVIASLIGMVIIFFLSILIYLPGFLWSESLMCCNELCSLFCTSENEKLAPQFWTMALFLSVPTLAFLVPLVIFYTGLSKGENWYVFSTLSWLTLAMLVLIVKTLLVIFWELPRLDRIKAKSLEKKKAALKEDIEPAPKNNKFQYLTKKTFLVSLRIYMFRYLLSICSIAIALLILGYFLGAEREKMLFRVTVLLVGIVISISMIAYHFRPQNQRVAFIALASSIGLMLLANSFHSIPKEVLKACGFNGQKIDLLLKDERCHYAKYFHLPCDSSEFIIVQNATILCPMGDQYFISYVTEIDTIRDSIMLKDTFNFGIKKEDVALIRYHKRKKEN